MRTDLDPENFRGTHGLAGMDIEDMTRRFLNCADWQSGAARPTLKQLEEPARAVHALTGYFFLADPLEEPLPVPDFRTVGNRPPPQSSPDIPDTVYLCRQRQAWYHKFVCTERGRPFAFIISAGFGDDVEASVHRVSIPDVRISLEIGSLTPSGIFRREDARSVPAEAV